MFIALCFFSFPYGPPSLVDSFLESFCFLVRVLNKHVVLFVIIEN